MVYDSESWWICRDWYCFWQEEIFFNSSIADPGLREMANRILSDVNHDMASCMLHYDIVLYIEETEQE